MFEPYRAQCSPIATNASNPQSGHSHLEKLPITPPPPRTPTPHILPNRTYQKLFTAYKYIECINLKVTNARSDATETMLFDDTRNLWGILWGKWEARGELTHMGPKGLYMYTLYNHRHEQTSENHNWQRA